MRQQIFRQTKQKFAGVAGPTSRIFVTYDGKDASRCTFKASAVNCAMLPTISTKGVSSWQVESFNYVTLGEIAKTAPATSAQTAAPLTIAAVSMVAAGAAFIASKRRSH